MKKEIEINEKKYSRVCTSVCSPLEKKLLCPLVPKVPLSIHPVQLVLLTSLWSLLVVFFGYLSIYNIRWLWAVSLVIILQIISDYLDGSVARFRHTGLIRWGYYMDHMLDYIFLYAILGTYYMILPDLRMPIFIFSFLCGAFMMVTFLSFSATNRLKISYYGIGPTEIRFLFIVFDIKLILFGNIYNSVIIASAIVVSSIGLLVIIYQEQQNIWKIDIAAKKDE